MLETMCEPVEVPEEDRLVRAAGLGDRTAFGELYVRYARMVHGILLARVSPSDAEDLMHDVFMSALQQLRELRTAGAFRGWLATIARNRAVDHHRKARFQAGWDESRAGSHPSVNPDALMVLDQIRRLPEAYRETLVLRFVEGMTGPEIARQTGLTPESVRVNLHRGTRMLREVLKGKETS